MKFLTLLVVAAAPAGVAVAEDFDIWTKTINNESNGAWYIQPEKPKAKYFEVKGIPGEHAFRIKANKSANPWDVQASSPVQGAINEGDVIMLVYYARAAEPALTKAIQSDPDKAVRLNAVRTMFASYGADAAKLIPACICVVLLPT